MTMSKKIDFEGEVLEEQIKLKDLCCDGAIFSFKTEGEEPDNCEYYENEFFELPSGGNMDSLERGAPGQLSFKEISDKMENIKKDGLIKKLLLRAGYGQKIIEGSLVEIHYNGFWEGENLSFDSSYMRGEPKKFIIGEGDVLTGLEEAVKTMVQGEEAQFLISYKLLFGERGCPPRVKPEADGLFNIEVVRVIDSYKVTEADKEKDNEEETSFQKIHKCAKSLHINGVEAFKQNNLRAAMKYFHKAVTFLETSRQSCEEEQDQQQKLLLKLYTNLAVCYNKQNNPRKACSMCNEISRITNINSNCKALYQFGNALQSIGEYKRARVMFSKACALKPNDSDIGRRITELNEMINEQTKLEKEMCTKIFNTHISDVKSVADVSDDYKVEIHDIVHQFYKSKSNELTLPFSLSDNEIKFIKEVLFNAKYDITIQKTGANNYILKKLK